MKYSYTYNVNDGLDLVISKFTLKLFFFLLKMVSLLTTVDLNVV